MNIENNILLAEFLEFQKTDLGWFDNEGVLSDFEQDNCFDSLYFDTDWNWLMEVVEKIESLKPIEFLSGRNWIGFDVKIYKTFNTQTNYCTIKYLKEGGDMTISNGFSKSDKIEAVYNACVEFVTWYNSKK